MEPNNNKRHLTFYVGAEESELLEELRKISQPRIGIAPILITGGLPCATHMATESLTKAGIMVRAREPDIVTNILSEINNTRRYITLNTPEVTDMLYDVKYNNGSIPSYGQQFRHVENPPFSSKHQVCRKAKNRSRNKKTHLKKKR